MTHKDQFQLDRLRVSAHNEMVNGELFRHSADTAMLQMQDNIFLAQAEPNKAQSSYHMMAGARMFLNVLKRLGVSDSAEKKAVELPDNLRHEITK